MADSLPTDDPDTADSLLRSIDELDQQLLNLVSRRTELVAKLCRISRDPWVGRVAAAAARIEGVTQHHDPQPIDVAATRGLLRHVSSLCLQAVHQIRVAFLGPLHSYSHQATLKYFGDATALAPVASIAAVFDAVQRGDATAGVVPIENSTDGRVVDTLGLFARREMGICGEVLLPIHHNLLSKTPRAEIREVHSKPQALSQCRGWLANHLPGARLVETTSTAAAARLAAEQHGVAAVASIAAGREYELDVVHANIEDNPHNITRFVVIGTVRPRPTGRDKTTVLFQLHHQPGALADAMNVFKDHRLNLTWIESFPSPQVANEYLFFIELTGHREDAEVAAALERLAHEAPRVSVLGSYPRAET